MYPINRLFLAVFGGTQELGLPGFAFGVIVNISVDWIVFYLALLLFHRRKTRISHRVGQVR
jgi:hypothetical protein